MGAVQPGDVVFHRGRGPISRLIQRVTGSPWSHVSLAVDHSDNRGVFNVLDVLQERFESSIIAHDEDPSEETWAVYRPRFPRPVRRPIYSHADGTPTALARRRVIEAANRLHETLPTSYPYAKLLAYARVLPRRAADWLLGQAPQMVCSATVATAWSMGAGMSWRDVRSGSALGPEQVDPGMAWRQAQADFWERVLWKA